MCTLTWRTTSSGYQVLFNRDEQRTRSIATPPQAFKKEDHIALMPIDPDGQGSWIACNDHGLSLCLLNYYQGIFKTSTMYRSRGLLIRQLGHCRSLDQVLEQLNKLEWNQYPPFTLMIFDPKYLSQSSSAASIIWDGAEVTHVEQVSPVTSSSFQFKQVQATRYSQYQPLKTETPSLAQLMNYHASHSPQRGTHSVCMHRDDAHTVSLTRINVESKRVTMDYHQGSPCLHHVMDTVSVLRTPTTNCEPYQSVTP